MGYLTHHADVEAMVTDQIPVNDNGQVVAGIALSSPYMPLRSAEWGLLKFTTPADVPSYLVRIAISQLQHPKH